MLYPATMGWVTIPRKQTLDARSVYSAIMKEAKFRALSINPITNSGVELPVPLLREYGFLQLPPFSAG